MDTFLTYVDDDFTTDLDLLMRSPTGCNGFNSIFGVDINQNNILDLQPQGSLVSPDSTTQFNSAGLHDADSSTSKQTGIPSLVLPHSVWHDQSTWIDGWHGGWDAHIPTYAPLLSPTTPAINGNTLHVEQLLAEIGGAQCQPDHKECVFKQLSPSTLLYPPVGQPAKQQQRWQHAVSEQDLKNHHQHAEQQHVAHQQSAWQEVHLPPGLRLVAPALHQHAPVVDVAAEPFEAPTAAAAAAAAAGTVNSNSASRTLQQQTGLARRAQKRQMPRAVVASWKAARSGHAASPTSSGGAQSALELSEPDAMGATTPRMPTTPLTPSAAAAATSRPAGHVRGAAAGSAHVQLNTLSSSAGYGSSTLVWGKVNRFPWWPAVVISTPTQQAQQAPVHKASPTHAHGVPAQLDSMCPGSVFVRFLGTHDTAWLEPRKVSLWCVQQAERSSKTKAAAFLAALREGRLYASTGALPAAFAHDLPATVAQHVLKPQQQQQQQQPSTSRHVQLLLETTGQQVSSGQCHNNGSNSLEGVATDSQPTVSKHLSTYVSPSSSSSSSRRRRRRRQFDGQQEEVHEVLSSTFAAHHRPEFHGLDRLSGDASYIPDTANTASAAARESQGLALAAATTRMSARSRRSAHGRGLLQSRSGRRLRPR